MNGPVIPLRMRVEVVFDDTTVTLSRAVSRDEPQHIQLLRFGVWLRSLFPAGSTLEVTRVEFVGGIAQT